MAEITCCTGQTECNHIITIGYLKTFIGTNIKDSNGNTVYVNTSKSDSYVPTYSELTGGTLIPQFVDGGTNKWHSNVDGITVRGSYAANQGVEQTDLILTYTRFKSLSISAGKTTFDECGDNTSVCATYKFTKTIKAMNNCVAAESSSEGSDTTCKPSFSASCNWMSLSTCSNNCITASAGKNGTWSAPSRSCNIRATVRYKGQTYSSNTISITQEALTGSYSVYEGRHYTATTITSHDELTQNTCSGATVNASATAYYYDRYKWKDSCGLVYEYNYDDRYSSEGAGSSSYTFDPVYCPTTEQTDSYLMTITYQGHSDSVTFYQVCSQECEECLDFNTYGECNVTEYVDACGGEVTLSCSMPTTIHHKGWDGQGHCIETATTQTAYTQSVVVVIPENKIQGGPGATSSHTGSMTTEEGGIINYTVIQDISNPCGGCGEEFSSFTFSDVSVSCSAHTNETITVPYTLTKSYSVTACADVIEYGNSSYTINITSCNETTSVKDYTFGGPLGNFVVHQAAGNYHCCCSCDDFSLATNSLSWGWNSTVQKGNAYTIGDCISNVTASTDNDWFVVSVSNNSINVNPTGNNTTLVAKTGTITVTYKAHGNDCTSKTFTVSQEPYGCSCDDLTLGAAPSAWAWNETAAKSISYTANTTCISNVRAESDNTWFTVTTTSNSVNITPSGINDTTVAKTARITVRYSSDGTDCYEVRDISQNAYGCTCGDLTLGAAPSAWAWNETNAKTVSYTSNDVCISNVTVTSSTLSAFTASVNTSTKVITVTPVGQNTSTDARTSTITVNYSTNGSPCSTAFTVTQRANTCSCGDLTLTTTPSNWAWNETTAKTATYTINAECITDVTVTSSTVSAFTASVNTSTKVITVTPVGQNTSTAARTSTITVSYNSNGTPCSSGFTATQNPYGCSCGDLSLGVAPSAWNWNETTAKTVSYTANSECITDVSVTSSVPTAFTASVNTSTKVITVTPTGQNDSGTTRISTITVSYKSNGTDCHEDINVSQLGRPCDCDKLIIT